MIERLLKYSFSLLNVDYVELNHKWDYQNIISPYYRIYYVESGEGFISTESELLTLESGFIYIIPSFTWCNLKCQSFLNKYFIQAFENSSDGISLFEGKRNIKKIKANDLDLSNFKRLLQINPNRGINRSDDPKVYEKNIFYDEYKDLNNQQGLHTFIETQGIMLQIVSRFLSHTSSKKQAPKALHSKITDAISYIQTNLKHPISIQQLSDRAHLHRDYFSRLFELHTGDRPNTYIQHKRIERAQYLITTTDLNYEEIATETGFESLPYFSRVFKKITNITPGTYRKQNLEWQH